MLRVLENETCAAHELLAHLLAAAVGEVVAGDDETLPVGDVVADLVHLPVHRPPLRLAGGGRRWEAPRGGRAEPTELPERRPVLRQPRRRPP